MSLKNHTMLAVFLTAILAFLSAGASAANGMSDAEAQKSLEKMNNHWLMVVKETDPAKRADLMKQHEAMMRSMQKNIGMDNGKSGSGHMHGGSGHMGKGMSRHHMSVYRGMQMHQMMMDMMR